MKAVVQDRFGSPEILEVEEVAKPTAHFDEVLVRVRATSANTYGWDVPLPVRYLAGLIGVPRRPHRSIPGLDFAGTIEAVGKDAAQLQPGDEVFGWSKGAFAEYVAVPEDQAAIKPFNLTMEQAAVVPTAGTTALQALRKGQIRPEQKILIIGASGGVGTFAVQIAKSFGAIVTGVCSTENLDTVRSIGADSVIDYTAADFCDEDQVYDLIVDMVGNRSVEELRRPLRSSGTLVMVGQAGVASADQSYLKAFGRWGFAMILSALGSQTLTALIRTAKRSDLILLRELIESGHVTPVVSAQYPLSEASAATNHFHAGHARGRVVITM